MKKFLLSMSAITVLIIGLTGCQPGGKKNTVRICYNITGAAAMGASSGSSAGRSAAGRGRADDDTTLEGDIVSGGVVTADEEDTDTSNLIKVMPDGSVVNAVTMEGITNAPNIQAIIKSPVTDDVFILYYGATWSDDRILDPLVCVHPDGTYTNLLSQATQFSENGYLFTDAECIKFDENGNACILAFEGGHWEQYVYSYNPRTDERNTLYSYVTEYLSGDPNESVNRIMVGKNGKNLYLGGWYNSGNKFVRVVSVDNPEECVEIGGTVCFAWTYDTYNDCLIVSYREEDGHQKGTYRVSADGKTNGDGEKISDEYYDRFIPTSEGMWAACAMEYSLEDMETDLKRANKIINLNTNDEIVIDTADSVLVLSDMFGGSYYKVIGDYVYITYSGYVYDETDTQYANPLMYCQLFRFNIKDKTYDDILKNSDSTERLTIYSWSVNESTLYYSGKYAGKVINGKVDLTTLNHEKINTTQKISCLAAM